MSGKFALIIGNTEYTDPGLRQLMAPSQDAQDLGRVLKDPNLCAFDDVKVLLNEPEHILRREIEIFFSPKKPDDLTVLYFSGHGIRDDQGDLYLAVKDTLRTSLRSTAIKSDYVKEVMEQSRSKRQVLILDCCNSGAFESGTKGAIGLSIGTAYAFQPGYGRIVLTASDASQYAWEGDRIIGETDNSLFTHYLVTGLEGEADRNGDGCITVDDLYDYAYDMVKLATPKQTPSKFSIKEQGEIILRQFTRLEDIKLVPLPAELLDAITDPRIFVREGAVQQLGQLLEGKNLGLARSAREALERIGKEDDSRQVSRAASQVLGFTVQEKFSDMQQNKPVPNDSAQEILRASQSAPQSVRRPDPQSLNQAQVKPAQGAIPSLQTSVTQGAVPRLDSQKVAADKAENNARSSVRFGIVGMGLSLCMGPTSVILGLLGIYFGFRGLGSSRKADALVGLVLSVCAIVAGIAATWFWIYLGANL